MSVKQFCVVDEKDGGHDYVTLDAAIAEAKKYLKADGQTQYVAQIVRVVRQGGVVVESFAAKK